METNAIRKFTLIMGIVCLALAGCAAQPSNEGNENRVGTEQAKAPAGSIPESTEAETAQTTPASTENVDSETLSAAQEPTGEAAQSYQPPQPVDSDIELDLAALDMQSTSADIQARIAQSQSLWHTVWLDGMITWYAPDGQQAPPQVYRGQIWFDQNGMKFRSLTGTPGEDPSSAKISDGQNIYEVDPQSGSGNSTTMPTFAQEGVNLAGIVGSPLSELLFSGSLGQRGGNYMPTAVEKIAGRPALVVDWYSDETQLPVDRFWVDAQTGVFLRMQHFSKAGGDVLSSDIQLTQIFYNLELAQDLFRLPSSDLPVFTEDWSSVSTVPHKTAANVQSPAGLQPGELYFNWTPLTEGGEIPSPQLMRVPVSCLLDHTCSTAEAVAGAPQSGSGNEYYPLTLTWSPDGSRAAATQIVTLEDKMATRLYLYQPSDGSWTQLGEYGLIDEVSWSPDGQWIAFQINMNGYQICAIRADGSEWQVLAAGEPISGDNINTEILRLAGWEGENLYYLETVLPDGTANKIFRTRPGEEGSELVREYPRSQVSESIAMVAGGRFLSMGHDDHFRYLNLVDLNGANLEQLIRFKKSYNFFTGSADGSWIAFTLTPGIEKMDFSSDIFLVHPDGTGIRQIASFEHPLESLLFSPDNQYLLISSREELGQLFLVSIEDGSRSLLQIPGLALNDQINQISWRTSSQ